MLQALQTLQTLRADVGAEVAFWSLLGFMVVEAPPATRPTSAPRTGAPPAPPSARRAVTSSR